MRSPSCNKNPSFVYPERIFSSTDGGNLAQKIWVTNLLPSEWNIITRTLMLRLHLCLVSRIHVNGSTGESETCTLLLDSYKQGLRQAWGPTELGPGSRGSGPWKRVGRGGSWVDPSDAQGLLLTGTKENTAEAVQRPKTASWEEGVRGSKGSRALPSRNSSRDLQPTLASSSSSSSRLRTCLSPTLLQLMWVADYGLGWFCLIWFNLHWIMHHHHQHCR